MEYTVTSFPTKYNGVVFRSRLEAKWAAFLDILGWEWLYEPIDFGEWSPDFLIKGDTNLFVECKPTLEFPVDVAARIDRAFPLTSKGEPLILGLCPISNEHGDSRLGWIREDPESAGCGWGLAALGRWTAGHGTIGICHDTGWYKDRISGGYDGGSFGTSDVSKEEVDNAWKDATNIVKWIPKTA